MSSEKAVSHTVGPWTVGKYRWSKAGIRYQRTAVLAPEGRYITTEITTGANSDADARLIATAPDLLAACEAALDDIDPEYHVDLLETIQAAVKRAKGEL